MLIYLSRLKWLIYSSLSCSATYSGWQPAMFSSREAGHPVLQMWRAMQGRGAASPDQPLPRKVLYLQGWVPSMQMLVHLRSGLQSHPSRNRLILSGKLNGGLPLSVLCLNLDIWESKFESNPMNRIPYVQWRVAVDCGFLLPITSWKKAAE